MSVTQKGNESTENAADTSPQFDHHWRFFEDSLDSDMETISVSVEDRKGNVYDGEIEIAAKYDVVRGRKKPTGPKCFSTQRKVCDAWLDMTFPAHNYDAPKRYGEDEPRFEEGSAQLYSWSSSRNRGMWGHRQRSEPQINFEGIQYPDGSGELIHYGTTAAIRTNNGLIINNRQNWASGFATVTEPKLWERDYVLPLDGIETLMEAGEQLFDIVDVIVDNESWNENWNGRKYRTISADEPVLVLLASGDAICVGRDSTAADYNQSFFGFRIDADEVASLRSVSDAMNLLKPDLVAAIEQKGMEISEKAGDTNGDNIIRQGEWFLIPMPEDFDDTDVKVEKVYADAFREGHRTVWTDGEKKRVPFRRLNRNYEDPNLGSHIPRDKGRRVPTECDECDGTSFEMDEQGYVTCEECESDFGGILVRGTFRHIRTEHDIVNLGERWHAAVTHDRDVMVFDTSAGTGSGGWD